MVKKKKNVVEHVTDRACQRKYIMFELAKILYNFFFRKMLLLLQKNSEELCCKNISLRKTYLLFEYNTN